MCAAKPGPAEVIYSNYKIAKLGQTEDIHSSYMIAKLALNLALVYLRIKNNVILTFTVKRWETEKKTILQWWHNIRISISFFTNWHRASAIWLILNCHLIQTFWVGEIPVLGYKYDHLQKELWKRGLCRARHTGLLCKQGCQCKKRKCCKT